MAINLLPQNLKAVHVHRNYLLITSSVSVSVFVLTVVSLAVLFSYRVVVTRNYDQLIGQRNQLSEEVNKYNNEEWYLATLHQQLATARQLIANRVPYGDLLEKIRMQAGTRIGLDRISVNASQMLVITGNALALTDLANFMVALDDSQMPLGKLELTQLRFVQTDYSFAFAIETSYEAINSD